MTHIKNIGNSGGVHRILGTICADEDVVIKELSSTVGGNIVWFNPCGKLYGESSVNL